MSFILKESFKLILRSKLNFILNLISLTLCVLLILLSFYILKASDFLQNYVSKNLSLSVFINDDVNQETLDKFRKELLAKPYTSSVEFISKENAAEIFLKETGEDFRKILDYNPLPASFTLYLKRDYSVSDSLRKIISDLERKEIVTEVVSKMEFLQKIITFTSNIKIYIFLFTGFMILVSIYLVFSTVKLILNSKYEELETMKLVGAKLSTIKLPILLNIIFVGFLAGATALMILYGALKFFSIEKSMLISMAGLDINVLLSGILLVGPFIGFVVTLIALRKITLRV